MRYRDTTRHPTNLHPHYDKPTLWRTGWRCQPCPNDLRAWLDLCKSRDILIRALAVRLQSHRHGGAPGHQPAPDPLPDCTPEHQRAQATRIFKTRSAEIVQGWPVTVAQLGPLPSMVLDGFHQPAAGRMACRWRSPMSWTGMPPTQGILPQVSAFFHQATVVLWRFVDCRPASLARGASFVAGPTGGDSSIGAPTGRPGGSDFSPPQYRNPWGVCRDLRGTPSRHVAGHEHRPRP